MDPLTEHQQVMLGGVMVAAPWWISVLQNINLVCGTIVAVGGAFYVLRGAWRWFQKWRKR